MRLINLFQFNLVEKKRGWLLGLALLPLLLTACGSGGGNNGSSDAVGTNLNSVAAATATALPPAPTVLAVTSGNGEVTLSWSEVAGATAYNLYYLTYPGVTASNARQLASAVSGEPITGLTNTVPYYFVVTALNEVGESAPSGEVSATPMPALPGIPGNVQLVGGFGEATLSWQAVPYATSYNVYYGTSPGLTPANAQKISTPLTIQKIKELNVVPGHYYFMVTAVDASGEGPPSVKLTAAAIPTIKAVTAGMEHSAALRINDPALFTDQGTVWAWGANSSGQLGDQTNSLRSQAVLLPSFFSMTDLAAGYAHTVALNPSGIWTWGLNANGQLGIPQVLTTMNTKAPSQVNLAPPGLTAIATGYQHTIALKDDGTVWSWGYNLLGALGYPALDCANPVYGQYFWTCSNTPTQVPEINGSVVAIAGGFDHTLAVSSLGTVYAWGANDTGQLGQQGNCPLSITQTPPQGLGFDLAASSCSVSPLEISNIPGIVTAVSAGTQHSVALMSDGTVVTWGGNKYGQLGYDSPTLCSLTSSLSMGCSYTPTKVEAPGFDHIIAISAGSDHTLALKSDGTVWTWGRNGKGQLGNGSAISESPNPIPLPVPNLSGITAIAAGAYHSLAVKNNGTVWAWGDNSHYQLGNPYISTVGSAIPVQVQGLDRPVVIKPGM